MKKNRKPTYFYGLPDHDVLTYMQWRNLLRLKERHGRICYDGRKPLALPIEAHPPVWLIRLAQAAVFGIVVWMMSEIWR